MTGTEVRQRSTRDRPAKTPLSVDAVVDAALAILQSHGVDAVTMRRVAGELDTGAASLYVYVSGREGLLQAMLDRATGGITLEEPDPRRWRAQLHAVLERIRAALAAHPGIAAMTLAEPPTTDAVLRLPENLLGIMLAGGVESQGAVWACDIFLSLVTAVAREDDVRRRGAGEDEHVRAQQLYARFADLPTDRFPLITAHAAEFVTGTSAERFSYAIDVVLDGLLARPPR
jgi:AcrR family transcriptional regulator